MISTRNIVLSAASLVAVAQALTVNTPASAVQCQPVALGWGEGTAPFYVSIIPGGQPSAAALENLPTQQGTTYTWMVDIDAGTSITVKVVDSTGAVNYSDQITIQQGTSTSCSSSDAAAGGASSSSGVQASASSAASSVSSAASTALASARTPLSSAASSVRSAASSAASSVSSGVNAAAAATTSAPSGAAYKGATAGFGLLAAGVLFALAA